MPLLPSFLQNLLSNRTARGYLTQLVVLLCVGWLGWVMFDNVATNLRQQNIASGLSFLNEEAGFGISQTLIAYSEQSSYGRALWVGLLNTLLCAVVGIFFASLLGFSIGIARLSSNWLVAKLAAAYVDLLRNVPLLLQIFFWYFAVLRSLPGPDDSYEIGGSFFLNNRGVFLPGFLMDGYGGVVIAALFGGALLGWGGAHLLEKRRAIRPVWLSKMVLAPGVGVVFGLVATVFFVGVPPMDFPRLDGFNFVGGISIIPEFSALTLALSLYTAAFIAEIVRAGIQSVDRGQVEASQALGLSSRQELKLVVVPQALRVIIPPLTSQYLNLTKNSSLAVAIGYPDLVSVFSGTVLNQTGQAVEVIAITMVVYLILSLSTSFLMNIYNARMQLVTR